MIKKYLKLFYVFLLLISFSLSSGEITHASVEYDQGVYTVEFDATVMTSLARTYYLLTDFDNLEVINDSIVESDRLESSDPSMQRCRLLLKSCILFFCRDVVLTEDVRSNGKDEIIATIDPEHSDFESGSSVWNLLPADSQHTNIILRRTLEPDFWIPPVIGPLLIKNKMIQELSRMIEQIEQHADANTNY